jgi:serine/threonine-protein kinase
MTNAPDDDRIGAVVGGKYRIVRLLAQGGMGVVYEAQHTVVRRRFAIKFLRRELAERRDILNRFQREAEAAGALENENVTAAIDFGISDDGAPYIVMEYLVGENLADLIAREGRLPVTRATDLMAQACRGVAAAHVAGIVHRDLKPHNLFVSRRDDGTDLLKVLDFGVAKLQAIDEAGAATRTGTVLGTAAYMSPEQARGERLVDHRADVYGLGAILYELLSGKRPHPGDSQNAILHHIATQPAVPLDSVQPELPAALVAIVARTLASDPGARPASTEAMMQGLAPFARREVWPARPEERKQSNAGLMSTPAADRAGLQAATNGAASTAARRTPAPSPRRRPWIIATGALAVAVIGVIIAVRGASAPTAKPAQPEPPPPAAVVVPTTPPPDVPRPPPTPAVAAAREPTKAAAVVETPHPGRPGGHRSTSAGRPAPRPTPPLTKNAEPTANAAPTVVAPTTVAPTTASPEPRPVPGPTFDSENPYK